MFWTVVPLSSRVFFRDMQSPIYGASGPPLLDPRTAAPESGRHVAAKQLFSSHEPSAAPEQPHPSVTITPPSDVTNSASNNSSSATVVHNPSSSSSTATPALSSPTASATPQTSTDGMAPETAAQALALQSSPGSSDPQIREGSEDTLQPSAASQVCGTR